MKLWLDDVRPVPDSTWTLFHSVKNLVEFLQAVVVEEIEEISLDHDLGDYADQGGDGYYAVLWMAEHNQWPKTFTVHSANEVGARRMLGVADRYGPYTRKNGLRSRTDAVRED